MGTVEIVTIIIGALTICLLVTLLILMRTVYILVRRERGDPPEPDVPRAD